MQSKTTDKPLIVIIGPTAVGKSEIAIDLALVTNGEIVSADSRLLYRGMDIGTAKPTLIERTMVPHHLIDVADPNQVWSLAKYQHAAYSAINEIQSRGKIPYLVGGTGQYIKSIVEGWVIPEVKPNSELRNALNNWATKIGDTGIYDRLSQIDPFAAAKIDPQNLRRSIRALEVIFITGHLFSMQQRKAGSPFRILIIGINRPRPELYERIDSRIDKMIKEGLLEEVDSLLEKGYSLEDPPLSAIGYRQIVHHLCNGISLTDAVGQIKKATRNYVRRQANWFKPDDPTITWFDADHDLVEDLTSEVIKFLRA